MAKEQEDSGQELPSLEPVLQIVEHYAGIAGKLEEDIRILSRLLQEQGGCLGIEDEGVLGVLSYPAMLRLPGGDWASGTLVYKGSQIKTVPGDQIILTWGFLYTPSKNPIRNHIFD